MKYKRAFIIRDLTDGQVFTGFYTTALGTLPSIGTGWTDNRVLWRIFFTKAVGEAVLRELHGATQWGKQSIVLETIYIETTVKEVVL